MKARVPSRSKILPLAVSAFALVAACSATPDDGAARDPRAGYGSDTAGAPAAATASTPASSAPAPASPDGKDGGATEAGSANANVTAQQLLTLVSACKTKLSTAPYAPDPGAPATIDVCGLKGAVFFKADMDIDCDGKQTATCNLTTDPDFQPDTSIHTSTDQPLDAAALPFVVVPLPSSRFSYKTAGIVLGAAVAVIYKGQLVFGIFGDEGPTDIIGEASPAMAKSLGLSPNPRNGGLDANDITYIVFTGTAAKVSPVEDHAKAEQLGQALANKLVADNP